MLSAAVCRTRPPVRNLFYAVRGLLLELRRQTEGTGGLKSTADWCRGHLVPIFLPMTFTAIDVWIGRTLFTPLIVRFCQLTRQSQYAVSRLFWFVASLDGFYRAESLALAVIWGAMSILMMVSAAMRADDPTRSFIFFRLLAVFFLVVDVLEGALIGTWAGCEFWLLVLVAEYAATIRTIPPRERPDAKAAAPSASS